ncbi:MAG TPA: GBS Bsp-like repeat-containing protein [Candidatus Alectryocaccobium stercorigallinarum]|nr:GBS Bsp-like repeat-containing protein [Candidatus Alectryocaccobium stercorigallinarum]
MSYTDYRVTDMQWLPPVKSAKVKGKKIAKNVLLVLASILVFLAAYFPLTYRWAQTTWSDLTIQEILYHLMMPAEGTATGMVMQHITRCLVPAILITAAFVVVMIIIRNKPTAAFFVKGGAAAIAGIIIANTVAAFWKEMDVTEYMDSQSNYSSFIDNNYVDPASVNLTFPEQKRNLIYIFLESMENTFADKGSGGAFDENVIPELTEISLENENFSGGHTQLNGGVVMNGATWTMGAMFAHTCGLPLSISIDGNAMSTQDEFFPGATAIGDILEEEGYSQSLLLGSDATFGGRRLYFESHGNYQMRDYYYYKDNGMLPSSDYKVWWGYEDMYLFENAKTELTELASKDEPFNLTMLTADTHFEDGYVCSLCQNDTDDQYSNVYRCSSRQVSEFLDWCSQQEWYDNTTIVLAGDHLTMDGNFCDNVDEDYQRTVYTTIINGAAEPEEEIYREYTTMDLFPTTLAAMGVEIPGDRLALGTNLYSSTNTLLEIYGYEELNSNLQAKSELMTELTAGIVDQTCDINVMPFDSQTNTVQLIVSNVKGITPGVDGELCVKVYKESDQSDLVKYWFEDRGDGSYICTVNFADFDFNAGSYTAIVAINDTNSMHARDYTIGAVAVEMGDGTANVETPDTADSFGFGTTEFDYSSGNFEINYTKSDRSNLAGVQFAVWKQEDQSDLHWYPAELGDDGVYRVLVNAFDYAFDDRPFYIDIYEVLNDGSSKMINREYYRISDEQS